MARGWEKLLIDLHLLLRPDTANADVLEGKLCYSTGEPVAIPMDAGNLVFLERLLDVEVGSSRANAPMCGFLRDLM